MSDKEVRDEANKRIVWALAALNIVLLILVLIVAAHYFS